MGTSGVRAPGQRLMPFRALALAISVVFSLLVSEAAVRFVYRDAGSRTLGGPGHLNFEYLTRPDRQRSRLDVGPRRPGVPRLMALGDSITYGQGVRDWRDVWTEQLAMQFDKAGRPIEMAVFGLPGRGIAEHLEELQRWGPVVQPDALILQWYVNDIEVISHRPDETRPWQRWSGHRWLKNRSYLYFFLDHGLSASVRGSDYVKYLLESFVPGTPEWSEFERYFHSVAMRGRSVAKTRVLLLYPQVPYRGAYPLQSINDRMHALAGPHRLRMPPASWLRSAGRLVPETSAPWKQVVEIPAGVVGPVIDTNEYVVLPGSLDLNVTLAVADPSRASHVGTLEVIDARSNEILAAQEVTAAAHIAGLQTMPFHVLLPGSEPRSVRYRVRSSGEAAWQLADLEVDVDYGMIVVDLTGVLNTFDTHASLFDAHPNEAAHRVIADELYRALVANGLQ